MKCEFSWYSDQWKKSRC